MWLFSPSKVSHNFESSFKFVNIIILNFPQEIRHSMSQRDRSSKLCLSRSDVHFRKFWVPMSDLFLEGSKTRNSQQSENLCEMAGACTLFSKRVPSQAPPGSLLTCWSGWFCQASGWRAVSCLGFHPPDRRCCGPSPRFCFWARLLLSVLPLDMVGSRVPFSYWSAWVIKSSVLILCRLHFANLFSLFLAHFHFKISFDKQIFHLNIIE